WALDRTLRPFRVQVGCADLCADGRTWHFEQNALGRHFHGLLYPWQGVQMGRSSFPVALSVSLGERKSPHRSPDVSDDQSKGFQSDRTFNLPRVDRTGVRQVGLQ